MGMTDIHGPYHRVSASIKAAQATTLLNCAGYNSAMVLHTRTSGTGYSTVRLRNSVSGTFSDWGAHPAPSGNSDWGLNVRTTGAATSAASLFRGITPQVGISFVWTSGTHSLDVLFLNT